MNHGRHKHLKDRACERDFPTPKNLNCRVKLELVVTPPLFVFFVPFVVSTAFSRLKERLKGKRVQWGVRGGSVRETVIFG